MKLSNLDAADESGNTVVAIIKPTDKAFNVIPSVYGKKEVENLIKSSNVRYVNDIEIPATASIDLASLQLRGVIAPAGTIIIYSINRILSIALIKTNLIPKVCLMPTAI